MINHVEQRQRKTAAGKLIGLMVLALDLMIGIATSRQAQNPATSEALPKWEAVSVKPCTNDAADPDGRGGGPGPNSSPDRFTVFCRPLLGIVQQAYITSTRGRLAIRAIQVQGGPSWIESERYTITAKAEGAATRQFLASVMLQQILEDRFKLKAHLETREVPGYVLTVAKSGAKLQPFQGSCLPLDLTTGPQGPPSPGQERCPAFTGPQGPNVKIDAEGITLDILAQGYISGSFERAPVANKTGISGKYNFHLQYADPRLTIGGNTQSDVPLAPSIFAVLARLGLKLDSGKVPGDFSLSITSKGQRRIESHDRKRVCYACGVNRLAS